MQRLVIQSWHSRTAPQWVAECLSSVERWAQLNGYSYRFIGDTLFDCVPDWYLGKIANRMPIAADLARLKWARDLLSTEAEEVVWLDADTLILRDDPMPDFTGDCAFGLEHWVQRQPNGHCRVRRNVHNACCAFRRDGATLPFLIQTVESIIRRADSDFIAPQMVGPKLLGALHSLANFTVLPQFGALSPEVLLDISQGGGTALDRLREIKDLRLIAVNICASLQTDEPHVDRALLVRGAIRKQLG